MPSDLALITGASKGIGRSTALAFAKSGLSIYALGRNLADLRSLQNEINKSKGRCKYQSIDLLRSDDIEHIVTNLQSTNQQIRVLVHNAGIAKVGKIIDIDPGDWRATIDLNLTIPFLLTQRLLPFLAQNGHIFFINSVGGRVTFPEWSAYCSAKWGLRAFADVLRQELSGSGIKVTSVYPSSVDTSLHDQLPYNWDREKMLKDIDVANAIVACFNQSDHVLIKEMDLENTSGTF